MDDWDPSEFQAVITAFLDRRGWSQNELAAATGISQSVINRWMQTGDNVVQPTDQTLRKLGPIMGIPHNELMRLAGRLAVAKKSARPMALDSFIAEVERGWLAADEHRRQMGEEVVRAIFGGHRGRRPNRRAPQQGNHEGSDTPSFAPVTYAGISR